MKTINLFNILLLVLPPLLRPALAALPYNPTKILLAPNSHGSLAYIFQPALSSSEKQAQLLAFNTTSYLNSTSIPHTTLFPTLPFLGGSSALAYTPVVDGNGSIAVYTGTCALGADGAQLWRYVPDEASLEKNGGWTEISFSQHLSVVGNSFTGPNYLASGISFSPTVNGNGLDSNIYIFGGMCPDTYATNDVWTSSANYSNLMLKVDPQATVSSSQPIYDLGITSTRGPPVAEAGFSITALQPAFSNTSDGVMTQQQTFILIGGHTQTAFINMSQLALFSLPQESWTFLPIDQPSSAKTDLTLRDGVSSVDPRSGHTAVLSVDGTKVIVFGGWVGDVDTPADPQLAVLNLGEGFGGSGDWTWTVPQASGGGPNTGTGIYGHGAIMLPGNVMMVVGGYSIAAPSSSRVKRSEQTANAQNLFYNVTSNSWMSSYTAPPSTSAEGDADGGSPPLATSEKAGLGAGLALGFIAVAVAAVVGVWYARRLKRKRDEHEKEMNNVAPSAPGSSTEDAERGRRASGFPEMQVQGSWDGGRRAAREVYPWPTGDDVQMAGKPGWKRLDSQDAERTGLLLEIPSPTRGLRRSLSGRGTYPGAPRYDETKIQAGSGNIHVIDEREEEDNQSGTGLGKDKATGLDIAEDVGATILPNVPVLDPFRDPDLHPLRSNPVSPVAGAGSFQSRNRSSPESSPVDDRKNEVRKWVNEWAAAEARLTQHHNLQQHDGPEERVSPDKCDRTISSLSDASQRSFISSKSSSGHHAGGNVSRSISARSVNPLYVGAAHPMPNYDYSTIQVGARHSPFGLTNVAKASRNAPSRPGTVGGDADSFMTARTSFALLQSEGEALLGGGRDGPYHLAAVGSSRVVMSRLGPVRSKSKLTWMGSVKRAFGSTNIPRDYHGSRDRRSASMNASTPRYHDNDTDAAQDLLTSSHSSPTKPDHHSSASAEPNATIPRRAASDSTHLLARKRQRGAKDWDFETSAARRRKEKQKYDWGAPEDRSRYQDVEDVESEEEKGEEWDVERAVERRIVQFAFTIPRGSLRVVNAGPGDGGSMRSTEELESRGTGNGEAEGEEDRWVEGEKGRAGGVDEEMVGMAM